ncbi:hypothetical protein RRF57_005409 [Xylaria bambusicola]|uniref:Uncharacterized protein n=1 Tax=Xylaria bambusicola TaxID=326684 RepID=A0AAN7UM71_9PEZI
MIHPLLYSAVQYVFVATYARRSLIRKYHVTAVRIHTGIGEKESEQIRLCGEVRTGPCHSGDLEADAFDVSPCGC